ARAVELDVLVRAAGKTGCIPARVSAEGAVGRQISDRENEITIFLVKVGERKAPALEQHGFLGERDIVGQQRGDVHAARAIDRHVPEARAVCDSIVSGEGWRKIEGIK